MMLDFYTLRTHGGLAGRAGHWISDPGQYHGNKQIDVDRLLQVV